MSARKAGRRAPTQSSARARLMARQLPRVIYPLLVDDPATAEAQLQETVRLARQAMVRHDPDSDEYRAAEADIKRAQAAVDACYVHITLTALDPRRYEELVAEHPPTPEQIADKTYQDPYSIATFRPALLAECSDVDMAVDEWAEFLESRVSKGERQGLWVACLGINVAPRAAEGLALPKGLTTMLS